MFKFILFTFFKYISPFFLVIIILLPLYEKIFPWDKSKYVLNEMNGLIILVELGTKYIEKNNVFISEKERVYLNIDLISFKTKTIKIHYSSVTGLNIIEKKGGGISVLIRFIFFLAMTYFFWFPYKRKKRGKVYK